MNVGLPGTGLAGLFYLLAALWMPVHELIRTARGRGDARRWRLVRARTGMALGIIFVLWGTAWLLGLLLLPSPTAAPDAAATADGRAAGGAVQFLGVAPALAAFITLFALLLTVEVLRLLMRSRPRRRRAVQMRGEESREKSEE
jgi:hypothetical protein